MLFPERLGGWPDATGDVSSCSKPLKIFEGEVIPWRFRRRRHQTSRGYRESVRFWIDRECVIL